MGKKWIFSRIEIHSDYAMMALAGKGTFFRRSCICRHVAIARDSVRIPRRHIPNKASGEPIPAASFIWPDEVTSRCGFYWEAMLRAFLHRRAMRAGIANSRFRPASAIRSPCRHHGEPDLQLCHRPPRPMPLPWQLAIRRPMPHLARPSGRGWWE